MSSGPTQLIFAFEAVVIDGLGSLWGTLLGVAQTMGAIVDPQYAILAAHLVFLCILASPRCATALSRFNTSSPISAPGILLALA
jgi:branched-chain amino acid transport system permease protein